MSSHEASERRLSTLLLVVGVNHRLLRLVERELAADGVSAADYGLLSLSRVSIRSAKRVAAIEVGGQPYDATFAFGSAWATVHGDGALVRIDPRRNRVVKRFPLPQAIGVVGAFGSVWAAGADGVVRIDPATNRTVARIPLEGAGWTAAGEEAVWVTSQAGSGPFVVTEIGGEAWVPSWRGSDVRRFRP